MGTQPAGQAVFNNVVNSNVQSAKVSLAAFSRITWMNSGGVRIAEPNNRWLVTRQEPSQDIGLSEPTDLDITLTISPPPMPL